MEKKTSTGFSIENLLLIESSFKRIDNVSFGDNVRNSVDIETEVGVQGNIVNVIETVSVEQLDGDKKQVSVKVKMAGVFKKEGDSVIPDIELFGKVNGAAIIFPYIREHITNLSIKAGLNPIILPPVNFTVNKDKSHL